MSSYWVLSTMLSALHILCQLNFSGNPAGFVVIVWWSISQRYREVQQPA